MVTLSGLLRFVQETRSGNAAEALLDLIITTCTVERQNGGTQEIALDDVVVGDVVRLSAGDMKADVNFHRIIVEFTRNRFFIRLIDQMRTRMEQATVNSLTLKNRHINALKEHQKIFRCICAGSGDDAVEAYRDHMAITMEILKKTGLV